MAAHPASDTVKIARWNIRLAYIFWLEEANYYYFGKMTIDIIPI